MYEYKVIKLYAAEELESVLNRWAKQGWRCKFQYVVQGFGGHTLVITLERKVGSGASSG